MYGGLHRFPEIVEGAFTHAVEPFVGPDFGEEPILPGITGNESFDLADTHIPLILKQVPARNGTADRHVN
jgi:hypothetical protein